MPTTMLIIADTLPRNMPKLDIKGTNWAIFSLRFQLAVKVREVWNHFDGTSTLPSFPPPLTPDQTIAVDQWHRNESLAMHLLVQNIPDSTALRISNLTTAYDMWNKVVREYTEKELAGVRVTRVDEKDRCSIIIKSIPTPLANFAASQLASARLFSPTKTIEPDVLISIVAEEAERLKYKGVVRYDYKDCDRDEAMDITSPPKRHGRDRGKRTTVNRGGLKGSPPECSAIGRRDM